MLSILNCNAKGLESLDQKGIFTQDCSGYDRFASEGCFLGVEGDNTLGCHVWLAECALHKISDLQSCRE